MYLHPADLSCDDPDLQNTRHWHRYHCVLYKVRGDQLVRATAPWVIIQTLCLGESASSILRRAKTTKQEKVDFSTDVKIWRCTYEEYNTFFPKRQLTADAAMLTSPVKISMVVRYSGRWALFLCPSPWVRWDRMMLMELIQSGEILDTSEYKISRLVASITRISG